MVTINIPFKLYFQITSISSILYRKNKSHLHNLVQETCFHLPFQGFKIMAHIMSMFIICHVLPNIHNFVKINIYVLCVNRMF